MVQVSFWRRFSGKPFHLIVLAVPFIVMIPVIIVLLPFLDHLKSINILRRCIEGETNIPSSLSFPRKEMQGKNKIMGKRKRLPLEEAIRCPTKLNSQKLWK